MSQELVDLSHPIDDETPAFPGDPPVEITILDSIEVPSADGQRHLNSSRLGIGTHCGTHMDAPFHFFPEGNTIDKVPLAQCNGSAAVVNLSALPPRAEIRPDDLLPFEVSIRRTKRILLNSGWYHRWKDEDYFEAHPVLARESARWLVACGVELVGVDFPSLDQPPHEAHVEILSAGVIVLENLTNLDRLSDSEVSLMALPLPLVGRDGSPVRVAVCLLD